MNQKQKLITAGIMIGVVFIILVGYNQSRLPEPIEYIKCPDNSIELFNTSKIMFCNNTVYNSYVKENDLNIELGISING